MQLACDAYLSRAKPGGTSGDAERENQAKSVFVKEGEHSVNRLNHLISLFMSMPYKIQKSRKVKECRPDSNSCSIQTGCKLITKRVKLVIKKPLGLVFSQGTLFLTQHASHYKTPRLVMHYLLCGFFTFYPRKGFSLKVFWFTRFRFSNRWKRLLTRKITLGLVSFKGLCYTHLINKTLAFLHNTHLIKHPRLLTRKNNTLGLISQGTRLLTQHASHYNPRLVTQYASH